jgi:hypothetical protein
MAATTIEVAKNLFHYARGNPQRVLAIRNAFDAAMTGALTKGGMDLITNANKNGVSMSKLAGMHEGERQTALRYAIMWLDAGFIPSQSRAVGRF